MKRPKQKEWNSTILSRLSPAVQGIHSVCIRRAAMYTTVIRTGSITNADASRKHLTMGPVGGKIAENHLEELYTEEALLYQRAFFVYNQ